MKNFEQQQPPYEGRKMQTWVSSGETAGDDLYIVYGKWPPFFSTSEFTFFQQNPKFKYLGDRV